MRRMRCRTRSEKLFVCLQGEVLGRGEERGSAGGSRARAPLGVAAQTACGAPAMVPHAGPSPCALCCRAARAAPRPARDGGWREGERVGTGAPGRGRGAWGRLGSGGCSLDGHPCPPGSGSTLRHERQRERTMRNGRRRAAAAAAGGGGEGERRGDCRVGWRTS